MTNAMPQTADGLPRSETRGLGLGYWVVGWFHLIGAILASGVALVGVAMIVVAPHPLIPQTARNDALTFGITFLACFGHAMLEIRRPRRWILIRWVLFGAALISLFMEMWFVRAMDRGFALGLIEAVGVGGVWMGVARWLGASRERTAFWPRWARNLARGGAWVPVAVTPTLLLWVAA